MSDLIELQELRIGNLLDYKGKFHYVSTLSLDLDDEYQETIGICELCKRSGEKVDWNRALVHDLKRVPITDELLVRLGLNKNDYSVGYTIKDEGWRICIEKEMDHFSISVQDEYQIAIVKYLHELQNIAYLLTGKELTI